MQLTAVAHHAKELLGALHTLKTEHQYLGRYSVDKLRAFHKYQASVSIYRVLAVVLLSPLPTLLVLAGLDCIRLRDPRRGATQHASTFLRSVLSHWIMTYMFLLAGKQAMGLSAANSNYTHAKCMLIAMCVSVSLEVLSVAIALAWKFPVPMREFLGVVPWGVFVVLFNYVLAKKDIAAVLHKLKRYIPVVGMQLVLFYFLLGLSIVFAAVPYPAQLAMIFAFPVLKLAIKRQLWKFSRELDDISADVTICMVEISGSLYQTVCMQYVTNSLMVLLIMGMDFTQAILESRTYMSHEYVGDGRLTLQTAVRIAEAGVVTRVTATARGPRGTKRDVAFAPWESPHADRKDVDEPIGPAWSLRGCLESLLGDLESAWGRLRRRQRAQRHPQYAIRAAEEEDGAAKGSPPRPLVAKCLSSSSSRSRLFRSKSGSTNTIVPTTARTDMTAPVTSRASMAGPRTSRGSTAGPETSRASMAGSRSSRLELATATGSAMATRKTTATVAKPPSLHTPAGSVYVQAQLIRKKGSKRLMDFGKIDRDAGKGDIRRQRPPLSPQLPLEHEATTEPRQLLTAPSPALVAPVASEKEPIRPRVAGRSATSTPAPRRRESMFLPAKHLATVQSGRARSLSWSSGREPSQYSNGGSVELDERLGPPRRQALNIQREIQEKLLEAAVLSDSVPPTERRLVRQVSAGGVSGITIDNVFIQRRHQARILEQTLQLLFAAEVLLFVEYMEMFIPVLYAACVEALWHLPNAKYNTILNQLTDAQVIMEVGTSVLYAALELLSFLSVYWFVKKRYGVSALYQLAFLLETYWMTLQGKLIGYFITILNSSTIHQGIDLTFRFNATAELEGVPLGD